MAVSKGIGVERDVPFKTGAAFDVSAYTPSLLLIVANVASSVALVGTNKFLVVYFDFRFILLLSAAHFFVGWAFLHFASNQRCGASRLFERKRLAASVVLPVALMGMASILIMNYSLRYNTVGSYQILKVAVLPVTVMLSALQGTRLTRTDVGAALLVTLGTGIATVTDVSLTLVGTGIGLLAVVATAQYQIYQGRIQSEQKVSSTQALHCISLPQAALTLAASVLVETTWGRVLQGPQPQPDALIDALEQHGALRSTPAPIRELGASSRPVAWPQDIWTHPYTSQEVGYVALTCLCAVVLNYSGIALIGKINPIAFQFVNQLKTVCVMSVGFLVFAEAAGVARLLSVAAGLACVLAGIFWYTIARQRAQQAAASVPSKAPGVK